MLVANNIHLFVKYFVSIFVLFFSNHITLSTHTHIHVSLVTSLLDKVFSRGKQSKFLARMIRVRLNKTKDCLN